MSDEAREGLLLNVQRRLILDVEHRKQCEHKCTLKVTRMRLKLRTYKYVRMTLTTYVLPSDSYTWLIEINTSVLQSAANNIIFSNILSIIFD